MANISVIIPVYNAQSTIEKTVNSVLKSKDDIELILVIDGLTDNSLNICEEMKKKDSRIKIIVQENKGALCARINGVKTATGNYIMFLDADDEYIDGIFRRMNEIIEKYSPDLIKFRYKKENYEQYKYFSENEIFINKKDFKEEQLVNIIRNYCNLNNEQILKLRECAYESWKEKYNAKKNYTTFVDKLQKI